KDSYRYDSKPGMLDPNLLVLALKRQVNQGDKSSTLDLARKKELKAYHYELGKKETIETPAGTFKTQAVDRVRDDKNFTAWYATAAALQVPVELSQDTAGGISLLLQSYESKAD